jgi:heterodisulfide reductase subunit A
MSIIKHRFHRKLHKEDEQEALELASKSVLILGAGIAGIQSAIDLANMGNKVYLVEKKPSIGGRMAQLDKTFPTNDCSMCILAPKMIECANHENITLLTHSEG